MKRPCRKGPGRSLCLFLSFASLLFACRGGEPRVGLASYNQNDPYILGFTEQIIDYAAPSYTPDLYNAMNSQMRQNEQIEGLIDADYDLLIINPVDRLGTYPLIRQLRQEEVPVIFFNREPLLKDLMLWEEAYYVGARAAQSGQLQAELVMNLFGGDPEALNRHDRNGDSRIQAVILKGEQGHQDAEIRTRQVVQAFRDAGFALEILVTEVANWNETQAYDKMEHIIKMYAGRMEVLLSNNDAMALGAIDRMRTLGWFSDSNGDGRISAEDADWFPVVGIDGIERAVDYIQKGFLYGTVLNDSREQARAIVELSRFLLEGRDLSELSFPLEQEKYIWIDYKSFRLEE